MNLGSVPVHVDRGLRWKAEMWTGLYHELLVLVLVLVVMLG